MARFTTQSMKVVGLTQITLENSSAWFNMQPTAQIWSAGSSVWPELPFLWKIQGARCCLIPKRRNGERMLLRGGQNQHSDTEELLLSSSQNEFVSAQLCERKHFYIACCLTSLLGRKEQKHSSTTAALICCLFLIWGGGRVGGRGLDILRSRKCSPATYWSTQPPC